MIIKVNIDKYDRKIFFTLSNHDLNSILRKVSLNFYQPDPNLFSEEGLPVTITALSMLASGPQMCEFFNHVRTGNN